MKIEVLKTFVSVGETMSFSKAGERLYFSQSTVSRNISELEKALGVPLFIRNTRSCKLTPFGQQIMQHAKIIVSEWEKMGRLASDHLQIENVPLQIGYTYNEMLPIIAKALSDYRTSYSGAELTLRYANGDEITRLIRDGYLSCGVLHLPSLGSSEGLQVRLIRECTMCAMVPESHPFSRLPSVTMEQLSHETEVRVTNEKYFYEYEDNSFKKMNLSPMKSITVGNAEECMPVMLYYKYLCLSPSLYEPWPGFRLLPISDWVSGYPLVFISRKGSANELIERLYNSLCETTK